MFKNKIRIKVLFLLVIFFVFGGFKTEIKKDIPDLELYAKKYLATFLNRDEAYFFNKILLNEIEIDSMAFSINSFETSQNLSVKDDIMYYQKQLHTHNESETSKFYRIHYNLAKQDIMLNYNEINFLTSTFTIEKSRLKAIYIRGKINIYFESNGNIYSLYLNKVFLINNQWRMGVMEIQKKESTTLSNIQADTIIASGIDSVVVDSTLTKYDYKNMKSEPKH